MPDYNKYCQALIRRALDSNSELPRGFRNDIQGTWLADAVFQIAAIHDHEAPILYIGATMHVPEDPQQAKQQVQSGRFGGVLVAFSTHNLYWSIAGEREVETRVYPLSLQQLTIEQVQGNFYGAFSDEPRRVEVGLTLNDGSYIHLPVTPGATEEAFRELQDALPELREALTRSVSGAASLRS